MRMPGFSGEASIYLKSEYRGRAGSAGAEQGGEIVPAVKSTSDCTRYDSQTFCCVSRDRYGVATCCCVGTICSCGYKSQFNGNFDP